MTQEQRDLLRQQDLKNISECLNVANMIVDKDHREKVISRLQFLQSKIQKNETVDLSLEADRYAREYNISSSVTPSSLINTPMVSVLEMDENLEINKTISHSPDIQ